MAYAHAHRVLDALGDRTRRAIFERLAAGPRSVGELHEGMDVSRPAVSQHLKVLKEARLVRDRSEGTRRIYEIDTAAIEAVQSYLDRFWDRALAAFRKEAEAQARTERRKGER